MDRGEIYRTLEEVFAATGIGYTLNQAVPCLVRRRQAPATRFVTVTVT